MVGGVTRDKCLEEENTEGASEPSEEPRNVSLPPRRGLSGDTWLREILKLFAAQNGTAGDLLAHFVSCSLNRSTVKQTTSILFSF